MTMCSSKYLMAHIQGRQAAFDKEKERIQNEISVLSKFKNGINMPAAKADEILKQWREKC